MEAKTVHTEWLDQASESHVKTPFTFQQIEYGDTVSDQICIISLAECREVATIDMLYSFGLRDLSKEKETAAFIVRACNAHDDLVKSLREVHQACDWLMAQVIALDPTFRPTQSPIWDAILQGSAALAAAEQA